MPFTFSIRFYEELNDFLPGHKRKKTFPHTCFGSPAIKDIIESLGIPHTEVDLILANSQPVGFEYKPSEGDYISVYPVFESLDISPEYHLRPKPLRELRFIADVHLGKLAKDLRLLGFDTLYRNDLEDEEIITISVKDRRVVLTRDLQLLKNSKVTHGYYVRSVKPAIQIMEVLQRFDISGMIAPFRRCTECNGDIEPVEKVDVLHLLPSHTAEHFDEFYTCINCNRVYWKGSHYDKMMAWIENTLQKARKNP